MKKILLLLALLISGTLAAAQTVTVSGDLLQITGNQQNGVAGQTFVRFRLRNFSGNVPRINGSGLLAPCTVDTDTRCDFIPDSVGHFTGSLFGNDSIVPANTFYDFLLYINGRLVISGPYLFTAALCPAGCNLDTYAAINPPPTPAVNVAPFLGTNNIFTGTNTFNGAVTFNSTVTFNLGAQTFVTPKFTPPITINTANNYTWSFTNPAAPRTIIWPDPGASDTVAFLNATQTFTNKTLTSPALTSPTSTGTDAGTETLQNKTLGSGTAPSSPWATSAGGTGVNSTATFPTSGTVDTTTATANLQNKTLNGASSGNNVTLLSVQYIGTAITGTGADATAFSYSLPANVLQAGKGLRVTFAALHQSGTASVTYKIKFGATTVDSTATTGAGSDVIIGALVFNNAGVQNAQTAIGQAGFFGATFLGGSGATLPAENTTGAVTILGTFSVAATDTVRPTMFIVELIQ